MTPNQSMDQSMGIALTADGINEDFTDLDASFTAAMAHLTTADQITLKEVEPLRPLHDLMEPDDFGAPIGGAGGAELDLGPLPLSILDDEDSTLMPPPCECVLLLNRNFTENDSHKVHY